MALSGTGFLFAAADMAPETDYDFNEWYNREHVPERLGITGFIRGRRFVALTDSGPQYATLYETETPEAFTTEEYVGYVENPDENARHFLPKFSGITRTIGRIRHTVGRGDGGVVAFMPLTPLAGQDDVLRDWLTKEVMPALIKQHGVMAAHLLEKDTAVLAVSNRRHYRKGGGGELDWVLALEAATQDDAVAAGRALLSEDDLTARGAKPGAVLTPYRLLYCLTK
ncbi:MAG: hypothetical protein AB7G39_02910 [Alphaproteobacteria bacterium]